MQVSDLNLYCLFYVVFILLVLGVVWLFRFLRNNSGTNQLHNEYKRILDNILLPIGFKGLKTIDNGRERITSYQKDSQEVVIQSEPSFRSNVVYLRSGKIVTLESQKNNLPPEIKNKIRNLDEIDKSSLVEGNDLELDLDSDYVRDNFSKIIDKWLKNTDD